MATSHQPSPGSSPNIFTPPSSCLGATYTLPPNGNDRLGLGLNWPGEVIRGYYGLDADCYPPGFGYTAFQGTGYTTVQGVPTLLPTMTITTQQPLSPATCPYGYINAQQTMGYDSAYTAICCPSSMVYNAWDLLPQTIRGYDNLTTPLAYAKFFHCAKEGNFTAINGSVTTTVQNTFVFAPQISVTYAESDLPLFETAITPNDPRRLPSAGAKASIALGSILGVTLVSFTAGILLCRARKTKARYERARVDQPRSAARDSRHPSSDESKDRSEEHTSLCDSNEKTTTLEHPRRPGSRVSLTKVSAASLDVLLAAVAIVFLVYACLVVRVQGQAATDSIPTALLEAATYGPTIFPIVFAAIVGRFLRSLAALKMERGSTVLSMEYLLSSRTLVSALVAPVELRAWHWFVPLLLVLWTLSPLGSQASFRLIWTETSWTRSTQNLTYIDYVSDYLVGGSAAVWITPVNSLFASSLIASAETKQSSRDVYGNVKIPFYQDMKAGPVNTNDSSWRHVPEEDSKVAWTSLQGLPIVNLPRSGQSNFVLNTAYMGTDCNLTGQDVPFLGYGAILGNCTSDAFRTIGPGSSGGNCWSGAGFAIEAHNITAGGYMYSPAYLTFKSWNYWGPPAIHETLTVAQCRLTMNYVDVNVTCEGQRCRAQQVRPSENLAKKSLQRLCSLGNYPSKTQCAIDTGYVTPLNGLGTNERTYEFLPHLINATNPTLSCDGVKCSVSQIEAYLGDPLRVLWPTTDYPVLWKVNEEVFSSRLAQLLNTYWMQSVATYPIMGTWRRSLSVQGGALESYSLLSTPNTVGVPLEVVRCHQSWLAVLLLACIILIFASIATAAVNIARKAPDILTSFTSLLRYNPHAAIPPQHSLDDSIQVARRLRNTRVLFGNVRPEDNIGLAALAVTGHNVVVSKLERRKKYG